MAETSFVNRRWIRRPASGPSTSYLHVEKRSHKPVPERIASYSPTTSPNPFVHG